MTIRRFEKTDLAGKVEIMNACYPNWSYSLEDALHRHKSLRSDIYYQAFVVEEQGKVIAFAYLQSLDHYIVEQGSYGLDVKVHPEQRSKGHGSSLYELLLAQLKLLKWNKLHTECTDSDAAAQDWLSRLGYKHIESEFSSKLDLKGYTPPADHSAAMTRMEEQGIRLLTYGELDDPDKEGKLWRLDEQIYYDMPSAVEYKKVSLERWRKRWKAPSRFQDKILLAERDGELLGLTELGFPGGLNANAMIETTGTLAPHRGKGIATALKYACIDRAVEEGIPAIVTGNAEGNEAILRINRKLGFQPLPTWLFFALTNENYKRENGEKPTEKEPPQVVD